MNKVTFVVGDVFNAYDVSVNRLHGVENPWTFFIYINSFLIFTAKDFGYEEFAFDTEKEANEFRDKFIKEVTKETLSDYIVSIHAEGGSSHFELLNGYYQNVDVLLDDIRNVTDGKVKQSVFFGRDMRSGLYVYTNQILKHHVISLLKLK
jgi:hypothetical protein